MLKFSGLIIWRLGSRAMIRKYSSHSAAVINTEKIDSSKSFSDASLNNLTDGKENQGLVASVFASLNSLDSDNNDKPSPKSLKLNRNQILDNEIAKANDVNTLLRVAENPVISRRHALKMVSILSDWSSRKKVKIADFEKDSRFLKLCRILARSSSKDMTSIAVGEDLNTVLEITGDDEAARLISNLSLTQMIKVMKALHQKGRRSTPLLRALSHNITNHTETLDLKKSADLFFIMAALNFPDPSLMDKICNDVIKNLQSNEDKPAVVNSIVVSLGLLRYRHETALATIGEWMQSHKSVCRASDIASAIITFGTVDFVPPACEALLQIALSIKEEELVKPSSWLDLVFSFLTLNQAKQEHLTSTLRPEFIDKLLSAGEIPIPARRKLMAIDAYVGLKYPSHSPRLLEDVSVGVPIVYTKEKAFYVQSIMDTFKNLVSAEAFMKKECYSGMGFLYDAEFAVDAKCHPVPLQKAINNNSVHRIAVLGLDYHDMTRKMVVPLGVNQLYTRLLEMKGFKVLQIPYTEFSPRDNLLTRVQYIEKKIKQIASSHPS